MFRLILLLYFPLLGGAASEDHGCTFHDGYYTANGEKIGQRFYVANKDECAMRCSKTAGCTHFHVDRANYCYRKSNANLQSSTAGANAGICPAGK